MTSTPDRITLDWITIWQSESAALAMDREMQEGLQRMTDLWAAQTRAMLAWTTPDAGGRTGAIPAARATAPHDAPAGTGELDALNRRIDELERRLAGIAP